MTRKSKKRSLLRRARSASRPVRHFLTVLLLDAARRLAGALPHGGALAVGRALGRVAALFAATHRRRAVRQLQESGVAGDELQARRMAREVFEGLAMSALETLHALRWDAPRIARQVAMPDRERLEEAMGSGRGVLLVGGHFGNWDLLLPAVRIAFPTHNLAVVMAELSNERLTRWIIRCRESFGVRMIPGRLALRGTVQTLRSGGALGIMVDQDSRRGRGHFVEFFGRPAYVPASAAHLARRTGACLLPISIRRDPADPTRHVIRVGTVVEADPNAPEEEDLRRMAQDYTRQLEAWIRETPTQWAWIHDRWRRRPEN